MKLNLAKDVDFIQAFGITHSELDSLTRKCEEIIEWHRKANLLLITDLARKDGYPTLNAKSLIVLFLKMAVTDGGSVNADILVQGRVPRKNIRFCSTTMATK